MIQKFKNYMKEQGIEVDDNRIEHADDLVVEYRAENRIEFYAEENGTFELIGIQ